jgi:hypothetical protein
LNKIHMLCWVLTGHDCTEVHAQMHRHHRTYIYTQCEAPKIAKLVFNSNNYVTMVYGIYNYSYWGL